MGIVNEKFLILERERSLLKRKVSIEKRKLEELEMLQGGGLQKAITLISEAKAVGLIQDEHKVDYGNFTEIHNLLKSVEDWTQIIFKQLVWIKLVTCKPS